MPGLTTSSGAPFHATGIFKKTNPLSAQLGSCANFSLVASIVTAGGVCSCNLGIAAYPGIVVGSPINAGGIIHVGDEVAIRAKLDLQAAFNFFMTRPHPPENVLAGDLINRVFLPGVYFTDAALTCTGPMYFDDPNGGGVWIIKMMGGAYTPAAAARSILLRHARGRANQIFFVLAGGAFSSGQGSVVTGNIVSSGAITLGDGATIEGGGLYAIGGLTISNGTIFTG